MKPYTNTILSLYTHYTNIGNLENTLAQIPILIKYDTLLFRSILQNIGENKVCKEINYLSNDIILKNITLIKIKC